MSEKKNINIEELQAKVEILESVIAEQEDTIAELKEKTATASSISINDKKKADAPKLPEQTFKVGGKSYKFDLATFRIAGVKHLATECLKDKSILEMLVKDYPGVVSKA